MADSNSLVALRADIDSSLDLLGLLIANAATDADRAELLAIERALVQIATDIDNREPMSRHAAIAALLKQLGSGASYIDAIHQRAVNLKNTLGIAPKLLDAFGNIVEDTKPPPARVNRSPVVPGQARRAAGPGVIAVVLLLAAFAGNIIWAPSKLVETWLVTLIVVAISLALVGLTGGRWEATFIDNRNRMSLSKLQVMLWTVAIFSALLSAACFNAGSQGDISLIMGIVIDPKLWGLLGISVTTAVGVPLTLSGKESRAVSAPELDDTRSNLQALTGVPSKNIQNNGHILIKAQQADARWSDLIRGDDVGNGDMIDFSKVQQLYFTLLTLLIFGLAVVREFIDASGMAIKLAAGQTVLGADKQPITHAVISQLPVPDAGFLGLLAASGAGYLVYKGMSHSKEGP